jgi:hypothetical protein
MARRIKSGTFQSYYILDRWFVDEPGRSPNSALIEDLPPLPAALDVEEMDACFVVTDSANGAINERARECAIYQSAQRQSDRRLTSEADLGLLAR